MEWGIFCTFVPCMDSLNYIFGLAALAYIVTSTMFAAVRWWHTCPTTDKGYAYPDRRMQSLLYLVPAVVLAPCVAFPMRPSAHALATLYFVLCHSFFCALLLMTYFGQVKGWLRWKPWAVAQGVPVGVMVAAKAVEAWTDVAVMPERLAWWLTATVGAICLCYCIEAMRRVWLWMKPLGEDYYSNPDGLATGIRPPGAAHPRAARRGSVDGIPHWECDGDGCRHGAALGVQRVVSHPRAASSSAS